MPTTLPAPVVRWWRPVTVGALLALAFLHGMWMLRVPGLQYDELLFVAAATDAWGEGGSTLFVARRLFGVPTLLMDYIGALKAYLYRPIFGVFGVSATSIRLPVLIVSIAACGVVVRMVWRGHRPWVAPLLALLLVTEPVFLMMARTDWGPVALSGFLRVVALLGVVRFAQRRERGTPWLVLLSAALVLGMFNKLDFVIFTIALLVSSAWFHRRAWLGAWQHHRVVLVTCAGAVATAHALGYAYMFRPASYVAERNSLTVPGRVLDRLALVSDTFGGAEVLRRQTGVEPVTYSLLLPVTVVAAVTVAWLTMRGRSRRSREGAAGAGTQVTTPVRPTGVGFIIWVLLLTFVGLVASSGVNGAHHAALLWPLPALVVVLTVERLRDVADGRDPVVHSNRVRTALVAAVITLMALVVVTQVTLLVETDQALRDPSTRTAIWSEEPILVAEVLRREAQASDDRVVAVTADWGIGTQVQALTLDDDVTLLDRWQWFVSPDRREPLCGVVSSGR